MLIWIPATRRVDRGPGGGDDDGWGWLIVVGFMDEVPDRVDNFIFNHISR